MHGPPAMDGAHKRRGRKSGSPLGVINHRSSFEGLIVQISRFRWPERIRNPAVDDSEYLHWLLWSAVVSWMVRESRKSSCAGGRDGQYVPPYRARVSIRRAWRRRDHWPSLHVSLCPVSQIRPHHSSAAPQITLFAR